jgi:hypothetical protein
MIPITSTIGGLPPGGPLNGTELLEAEQDGVSVRIPATVLKGQPGTPGTGGLSAYQIAVNDGYGGTVTQWLASLVGPVGPEGTAIVPKGEVASVANLPAAIAGNKGWAYVTVDDGYLHVSTGALWVKLGQFRGAPGEPGLPGDPGEPGVGIYPSGLLPTDADILALNPVGSPGVMYVSVETDHIFISDNETWVDYGAMRGPQGLKGDPGDSGVPLLTSANVVVPQEGEVWVAPTATIDSVAAGSGAASTATGVALGSLAQATHADSVALGHGSTTSGVLEVSVGTPEDVQTETPAVLRRVTNMQDPLNDNDAVSKRSLKVLLAALLEGDIQTQASLARALVTLLAANTEGLADAVMSLATVNLTDVTETEIIGRAFPPPIIPETEVVMFRDDFNSGSVLLNGRIPNITEENKAWRDASTNSGGTNAEFQVGGGFAQVVAGSQDSIAYAFMDFDATVENLRLELVLRSTSGASALARAPNEEIFLATLRSWDGGEAEMGIKNIGWTHLRTSELGNAGEEYPATLGAAGAPVKFVLEWTPTGANMYIDDVLVTSQVLAGSGVPSGAGGYLYLEVAGGNVVDYVEVKRIPV